MERAGRLIGKMKAAKQAVEPDLMARALWPAAVGKRIANRTGRVSMVRQTMVVEVEDDVWRKQLFALRWQILEKVALIAGAEVVTALEFRVVPARRMPAREETPRSHGDTAGIEDPVFRLLYFQSRKRASA